MAANVTSNIKFASMKKSALSLKELRNGCTRTNIYIYLKNYKTLKHKFDLQKDWFVECWFYDPVL